MINESVYDGVLMRPPNRITCAHLEAVGRRTHSLVRHTPLIIIAIAIITITINIIIMGKQAKCLKYRHRHYLLSLDKRWADQEQ